MKKEGYYMNMKIAYSIKASDLLSLLYILSSDALDYHGLEEDEFEELAFSDFTEYVEHLANKKRTIQLLIG